MDLQSCTEKHILYCALDWGFGHTYRSIALISKLLERGNRVVVVAHSHQVSIYNQYLGNRVELIDLQRTFWQFKGDGDFQKEVLRNGFSQLIAYRFYRKSVDELTGIKNIDLVISDHVYGFLSRKKTSVFVTHQTELHPKAGFFGRMVHRKLMGRFDHVWVMDRTQELAGELSIPLKNKSVEIGWFSRFQLREANQKKDKLDPSSVCVIVSGPEVYGRRFVEMLRPLRGIQHLTFIGSKEVLESLTGFNNEWFIGGTVDADLCIVESEVILSYCGYSTLMDLVVLNKQAFLLATKGQFEQEYLAELHSNHRHWKCFKNEKEFIEAVAEHFKKNVTL